MTLTPPRPPPPLIMMTTTTIRILIDFALPLLSNLYSNFPVPLLDFLFYAEFLFVFCVYLVVCSIGFVLDFVNSSLFCLDLTNIDRMLCLSFLRLFSGCAELGLF